MENETSEDKLVRELLREVQTDMIRKDAQNFIRPFLDRIFKEDGSIKCPICMADNYACNINCDNCGHHFK